jgi:hypothetical protein
MRTSTIASGGTAFVTVLLLILRCGLSAMPTFHEVALE